MWLLTVVVSGGCVVSSKRVRNPCGVVGVLEIAMHVSKLVSTRIPSVTDPDPSNLTLVQLDNATATVLYYSHHSK